MLKGNIKERWTKKEKEKTTGMFFFFFFFFFFTKAQPSLAVNKVFGQKNLSF
jgi:hypothetical protein